MSCVACRDVCWAGVISYRYRWAGSHTYFSPVFPPPAPKTALMLDASLAASGCAV